MSEGAVIWLTGVPASGKTTLARGLVDTLRQNDKAVLWLDSDELRRVMTPKPTYSDEERQAFYDTLGYLAVAGAAGGVVVVVSATAMRRTYRDAVRRRVEKFLEIWLVCDPETLRSRDIKGLYAQADQHAISRLPGAGAAYEPPVKPELTLDTAALPPEGARTQAEALLRARGLIA